MTARSYIYVMAPPYTTISSQELTLFLDDVSRNVADDDDVDFTKLAVHLFGFANAKLTALEKEFSAEVYALLDRLLGAIELVFTRKKFLLNSEAPDDLPLLAGAKAFYEYAIDFALRWLPKFLSKMLVTNRIKAFLIDLINIVAINLHVLRYRRSLGIHLFSCVQKSIDEAFAATTLDADPAVWGLRLSAATHLFTVVNDHDLTQKLLLGTSASRLKAESQAKKLIYMFDTLEQAPLIDNLKAVLLLNLTGNLLLDSRSRWSDFALPLRWIHAHFEQAQKGHVDLEAFGRHLCISLLRILLHCMRHSLLQSFFASFHLHKLDSLGQSDYCQTLRLLEYALKPRSATNDKLAIVLVSFSDEELNHLRDQIVGGPLQSFEAALDFIVDKEMSYLRWTQTMKCDASVRSWLEYANQLVTESARNKSDLLDPAPILHSFISVLTKLPSIICEKYDFESGAIASSNVFAKNVYAVSLNRPLVEDDVEAFTVFKLLNNYLLEVRADSIQNSLLSVNTLLLVFEIFHHFRPGTEFIQSKCCSFVLSSLQHLNRDVRLLAARVLPLFFVTDRNDHTDELFKQIFQAISLPKLDSTTYLAESTIAALGNLATVCEGEWLCVLFVKIIGHLGEKNEQHSNLAYNCLLHVSAAKSMTPYKMLSPFLPSIAERIVKNSQMLNKMTELLGMSKNYFLALTREYTTPCFLEYYKRDFVQEIAEASNMDKMKLVTKTLPRILATYLCKDDDIKPDYIMNVLSNVSPRYKKFTLPELIPNIGEILWFILLQTQTDSNCHISESIRVSNAIKFVAKANWSRKNDRPIPSNLNLVEYILGEHVLELVQRFSENVHHIKGIKPYLEKVSSIIAIQFLISKNIKAACSALGQISTCLQASLMDKALELPAIICWDVLVQNLESLRLISLFDVTISMIFQLFPRWESRTKHVAVRILRKMLTELQKYKTYALYYFSLPFVSDLDKYFVFDAAFMSMAKPKSKLSYFPEFTRRIQTSNRFVVHQALEDLIHFTQKYQQTCQEEDFKDLSHRDTISNLVRNLLDCAVQFKTKDADISTKCAKALANIGSLDANKYDFKTIESRIVLLHDFQDYTENASFLTDFMKKRVIKSFWASDNPVKQLFAAYTMQRFLAVLGLDPSVSESSVHDARLDVWNSFSDIDKATLTPLLLSKYFAPDPKYEPLAFPHFRLGMKYENWLLDITINLLRRPIGSLRHFKASAKSIIFSTCSLLVRDEDVATSQYLLRYVALSHIISGDENVTSDILKEFLAVLNTDATKDATSDRVDQLKLCYQGVFEVIDYLNEWITEASQKLGDASTPKSDATNLKRARSYVAAFLERIPIELIATTSSQCDSYERTILYLEKCHREKSLTDSRLNNESIAATLQSVYSNIDDYDALDGVLKVFSSSAVSEKLRTFQYNENWMIAQESFKVRSKTESDCNTMLLRLLVKHAMYDNVLASLEGEMSINNFENINTEWAMAGLEAAISQGDLKHISRWSAISGICEPSKKVENVALTSYAKIFLAKERDTTRAFEDLYERIGQSLNPSLSSSFSKNSELMTQLHVMFDTALILRDHGRNDVEQILSQRLENTDLSFDKEWIILTRQKAATSVASDAEVSGILVRLSQSARKEGRLDLSTKCIMISMALNDPGAIIEYAHLLWAQGKQTEAIKTLHDILPNKKSNERMETRARAETQLQYALWLDESSHRSSQAIIAEYTKAYKYDPSWEKPYYDLGRFFNKIVDTANDSTGFQEQQVIRFYLKALALGPTYIFQALPKIITIWLDFAQRPNKSKDAERKLSQVVHYIQSYKNSIPVYVWYTSITQLLSRITHDHNASADLITLIVESLIKTYPKHSLWYVLSHVKSKDSKRRQRVGRVLSMIQNDDQLGPGVVNAKELFEILEKLASYKVKKNAKKRWNLKDDFHIKNLKRPFDSLVIPVKGNLEIRLPSTRHTTKSAFPKAASVTFDGFDEEVVIFTSLQMPKRVTIRGTNGHPYRLMVKRDDTRKDAKVFEFTNMINRLLSAAADSRKRSLAIENYSVIPLAEDMGVIEFVLDVATMKSVIGEQQKKTGKVPHDRKIFIKLDEAQKVVKGNYVSEQTTMDALVLLFENICKEFPPVLHQWFIDQFSDPAVWYLARRRYTRTAAVMSIVGYIIGLGDRHCENILFKKNGATLHIDFDCLFGKGLTLPTPEIVPFRLTQNMVDAMGITGTEGTFRVACEVTARLLRENEASLMNILETLIYDPLLDWKTLENPQKHLRKVRRKIRGLLDEKEGLPMNVPGQVDVLIQEASSNENLCQMYGGWAPYV